MNATTSISPFIRDIGRGKDGARSLSEADAYIMMTAILRGEVSDLELGAAVLALRMKGESVDELRGFLRAAHAHCLTLAHDKPVVVIPSYNGARKLPNLVPLLALLLAREGVSVLVHGIAANSSNATVLPKDNARVTTDAIFRVLGLPIANDAKGVSAAFAMHEPVFMPIAALSPALTRLLAVRQVVGVRNSGHTIVKLLAPFSTPCLRLVNFTHPEYASALTQLFLRADERSDAILMRGTEGEAVADARRAQAMTLFSQGVKHELVNAHEGSIATLPVLPASIDALSTATYIQSVLAGEHPVPQPITQQVQAVMQSLKMIQTESDMSLIDIPILARGIY